MDKGIADAHSQLAENTKKQLAYIDISRTLNNHTLANRDLSVIQNPIGKKVLLLKYATMVNDSREALAYASCKRMLELSKIPYDEKLISDSPITNNATEYAVVLISFALGTDLEAQPGYIDGTLGVPVIVAAGSYGWTTSSIRPYTHAGASEHGTFLFKLPGGYDYYTSNAERYCNITLTNIDSTVTRIIYDPSNAAKAHVWEVQGANNKTLFCANYASTSIGPWILYYIKQWGNFPNALPLPVCVDLDDINQITPALTVDMSNLQDLYDWAKSVGMLITAGIKTDHLTTYWDTDNPTGSPTPETIFARDHQDVFIPIIHDHHYGMWGQTASYETLKSRHESRLEVIRRYGFAVPDDMWGYLYQPSNQYNENAIAYWKNLGIVAWREAGAGSGVYSSDGTTVIPEAERIALSSPMMLVHNNAFTHPNDKSIADSVANLGLATIEEWKGLVCYTWSRSASGGMPTSNYKVSSNVNMPQIGAIVQHGNNCNGDNPVLVGLQLGDGIKKAFPGTCYYTHPSLVAKKVFMF